MTVAERLTFVLDGRDDLSRVLGHAGDSAIRLRDTMTDAADGSNNAILTLTRDADGRLRDMRGQFVSTADAARLMGSQLTRTSRPMADWGSVADQGRKVGEKLKAMLISLAPAAIPAAAAMAPLVAATAAAGAAVGVYAVALGPQIKAMGEAAEAEQKYQDAVEKSGASSKEAVEAQAEYARQMAKLPPATRTAAAALGVLKDEYKEWSDSLAADTMAPFTKGLAVAGGLLPKLTPLVRGTSAELDRMMTLLAGGMQSPGFDKLIAQFTEFSTGVLKRVNDGIVTLARNLDTGKVGGGLSEFMDYARAQGPVVGDTLRNIGQALINVLQAGSEVGVGMLQVVNVLSKLVAAVPPEVLTTLFQLVIAFKLVTLAAVGLRAAQGAAVAFGASITLMQAAAAGATGPLAKLSAAFGVLSRTAKLAVASTGIGLLVLALAELSQMGDDVPPDVDKLTTSLGQLGRTGRVSGEAARLFGKDLDGLYESVRNITDPSTADNVQNALVKIFSLGIADSTPWQNARENLDAIDESLANLVSGGKADLAAAAHKRLSAEYAAGGKDVAEFTGQMDIYQERLKAAALEQQFAADAMGLFGQQALGVQGKLDAQKQSTDGLRQSINALNNTVLQMRGGMRGFEAAIDAASEAAKANGKTLDINTEKGRANSEALDNLAAATMKAAEGARESGASWATVNGIYDKGRGKLIAVAQQMGLTEAQAKKLADQILRTPDKTARLRGNMEDLQNKLNLAKKRLASVPDSRKAAIRAEISQLEAAIREARIRMTSIDGKTAHTYIYTHHIVTKSTGEARKRKPTAGHYAQGGLVGFPSGGRVYGPGTGTSDSILARLSVGEYVIPARRVAEMGVETFDAIRDGRLAPAKRVPMPIPKGALSAPHAAMSAPPKRTVVQQFHITVPGLVVDPTGTAKAIDNVLTKHKRNNGGRLNFEG